MIQEVQYIARHTSICKAVCLNQKGYKHPLTQSGCCRQKLLTDPTTHPVLLSEACSFSKDQRERATERLFESFQYPAIFLAKNAVLSSFALGRQTSVVLDIGYDGTTGIVYIL
jgi:actin-related protein